METTFFSYRLRNFPLPVKVLAGGYLFALSLGYLYALLNIALIVGLTPKDIAIHYYGASSKIEEKATPAGEQSLDLDATEVEKPQMGPRPSFKNLVTEGHFHLFGMTSFFFGLTVLGLFTAVGNPWKAWMVGIPYVAIVLDNLSFLATRFLGPNFSHLTAASGGLMGISFLVLWIAIANELLRKGVK